jgi:hypothetical protein
MAIRSLAGYPQPVGEKYETYVDIDGPVSYANTGTFATSGQQLNASDLGFGGLESVETLTDASSDGVNGFIVVLGATVAGATNLSKAPPAGSPGDVAQSAVIHWYTGPSLGAEVANGVNLSGKYIRLRVRAV